MRGPRVRGAAGGPEERGPDSRPGWPRAEAGEVLERE